jgi:hypothetical protein
MKSISERIAHLKILLEPLQPASVLKRALFDAQKAFFSDENTRKVALCTRRAGKSHTAAALLIASALRTNTLNVYLTLTNKSAKSIMWPKLTEMIRQFGLTDRCKLQESMQTITIGDSVIRLLGADLSNVADRLRGVAYDLVVIDEAQSFNDLSLVQLCDDVIEPALLDANGSLVMIGTPGIAPIGRFFDLCNKQTAYSIHKWSVHDNPHIPHSVQWVKTLLADRGWTESNPTYRREYCGEWVIDPSKQVYKFDQRVNTICGKPGDVQGWRYLIGVDFGWHDATAICVVAYTPNHPNGYVVDIWSQKHATPTVVAKQLIEMRDYYNPDKIVCDTGGLGKAILEDFKYRYQIILSAADKTDKMAAIEMVNGDFIDKRFFIDTSCVDLHTQLSTLTWDEKYKENQSQHNDLCDAMLYTHRMCRHYWGSVPVIRSQTEVIEQQIKDFAIKDQFEESDPYASIETYS